MILRERCVENFDQALLAQKNGANFIELCDNLAVGGTTPSYGVLKQSKQNIKTPITVLIRARSGNFIYTDQEIEIMSYDILQCLDLGYDSIRVGALTSEGILDEKTMCFWKNISKNMAVSCHMAFDEVLDYFYAIDQLVDWGFDAILTKGHSTKQACNNIDQLKKMVEYAGNRIVIIPGSGITADNYFSVSQQTGATKLHGTKI